MARKIVVTSGKGGVGKTTIVANLGLSLANLGQRVALIDVDFGLNNLDVVLGVENKINYDLLDVFEGRCRIKQALTQCNDNKNLYILSSGSANSFSSITGQSIKLIIDSISTTFDYVILDCPAGIDIGFHRAVACADEAIVVVTPSIPSLRDADKVITSLSSYDLRSVAILINRARGDLIINEEMMMPNDIGELLKTEIIGVLPEEDTVFLSSGYGLPIRTESYKAYKILAGNICKNLKKIYDVTNKYSGFFGSIKRRLKKSI